MAKHGKKWQKMAKNGKKWQFLDFRAEGKRSRAEPNRAENSSARAISYRVFDLWVQN